MPQIDKPQSPFRNMKAVIGGAIIGISIFFGINAYHTAFPSYAPDAGPGVTVRPIKKDNDVKYMMYALMLGAAGFYLGTKALAQMLDKKK